ncbi:hypothetical protein [Streptomyces sp. WAC05858]|uniref:hypothetical protein n=1 Tax=Streptomyces TaxID=1883 RepID=UPI000F79A496|nr:hypothetical protein [Streptomyces sp. WAC05858]RSS46286.1 hypothetical protein EF902_12405 [Streptomyces sp. WAC05858]
MFSVEERDGLRDRLIQFAEADEAVTGAALTGSQATGHSDRWSDTDLVLAVRGDLAVPLSRWTQWLHGELGALHHWDLPADRRIIRVFLLPGWLEVDLTFCPEEEFGPRGPQWRTIFGEERTLAPFPQAERDTLIGLAWHHALHAHICIRRGREWQAEYWISALRDHVVALACLRLGYAAVHAKGAHLLPAIMTAPLEATLVRSVAESELRRALKAAVTVLTDELEQTDSRLAARLSPMLAALGGEGQE